MQEGLPQSCSTNESESKHSFFIETLSRICSADKEELSSTEEDKSECANKTQRSENNEVTNNVTNYFNVFNVFKCGINILDRLDESYKRACISIQSTISDSEISDSEEQVDAKNKSEKRVDVISNSDKQVDAVSEAKAYRN